MGRPTSQDPVQEAIHQAILACHESPLLNKQDKDRTDCFFVADLGEVTRQYTLWKQNLPGVTPFYAVKCNPSPPLLTHLSTLSPPIFFDCASLFEIKLILSLNIPASRILFASPVKSRSALAFAARHGINTLTFDNEDELSKIAEHHPHASLYLRIIARDPGCAIDLSEKFGAEVGGMSRGLLRRARELGLRVEGVAFHVGTGAKDGRSYVSAVEDCRAVMKQAEEEGFEIGTVDVGGGFGWESFGEVSRSLRGTKGTLPGGVRIVGEPGRFLAATAYTLACQVVGVRRGGAVQGEKEELDRVYLSDGVFGNFMNCLVEKLDPVAYLIKSPERRHEDPGASGPYEYSLWGPTCDSTDKITDRCSLPEEVRTDDWICFPEMGAYTSTCATSFNGFPAVRKTIYVNSES
ncbi:Putative ornithine/DAP/Arg decarboxylase, alanine racemase/group IV decarboxylase [Septoria linicola]|uniref:Ornithine/DAP/Arg decarboxylase, alanine racemase/group IV decarboxylase n=1 Tax=Septoria linicola TaxID=215465 RepID=A0A9Q9BAH5_9PEZI|nr:Putative ornithine/DAP/Arg decarboxylase, alanine racemase/group IV decarboxylase [Septoria linicola]